MYPGSSKVDNEKKGIEREVVINAETWQSAHKVRCDKKIWSNDAEGEKLLQHKRGGMQ